MQLYDRNAREQMAMLLDERARRAAASRFAAFLDYVQPGYDRQWFHTLIADMCQELVEGRLGKDRLMIFVPPQHGKSEIVSRKLPAWILGKDRDAKIVGASYSGDLAKQFSRSIQRTIDCDEYREVFDGSGLQTRAVEMFETTGNGFYKAVGLGGSLTGTPADIGIIDDPVKDAIEASSRTYRERAWSWYTDVFLTRLHNRSKQIIIQTRWHVDDLAGKILEREQDKWRVIRIPAIREDSDMDEDPRNIGEALWESKHSITRLREIEERSPRTFAALYQQRPTVAGGNIVKSEWFQRISQKEYEEIAERDREHTPVVFFIDTAYTDKSDNDPTGIIATRRIGNSLYITHAKKVLMRFPDLLRFLPAYVEEHGYGSGSSIRIEPKANGISVVDQMKESTRLNVMRTPTPNESKETRLNVASPTVESGRIVLVDGPWNEGFTEEVCGFPAQPHDEYVDVLCYAIDHHFNNHHKQIDRSRIASIAY